MNEKDQNFEIYNNPEAEAHKSYAHAGWMTRQRESMRVTPLVFFLRIIANEIPLNFEKTTSSVLSVFGI